MEQQELMRGLRFMLLPYWKLGGKQEKGQMPVTHIKNKDTCEQGLK